MTVLLDFLRPTNVDAIIATNVPAEALLPTTATPTTVEMADNDDSDNDNEQTDSMNNKDKDNQEVDEMPYALTGHPPSHTLSQRSTYTHTHTHTHTHVLLPVTSLTSNNKHKAGPPPFDFVVDAADGVTDKVPIVA